MSTTDTERHGDGNMPVHIIAPTGAPCGLTVTYTSGRVQRYGCASAAEAVGALFYFQADSDVTEVVLGTGAPCVRCAGCGDQHVTEVAVLGGCPRCAGTGHDPDLTAPALPVISAAVAEWEGGQ